MKYGWANGSRIGAEPDRVAGAFERIRAKDNGRLTVDAVVAAARNPRSVLHPLITWDDAQAADRWRREEAAYLIRSLIVYVEHEQEVAAVRLYVSVHQQDDARASYTRVSIAASNQDLWTEVEQQALRSLVVFRAKYRNLSRFRSVCAAIDAVFDEQTAAAHADDGRE